MDETGSMPQPEYVQNRFATTWAFVTLFERVNVAVSLSERTIVMESFVGIATAKRHIKAIHVSDHMYVITRNNIAGRLCRQISVKNKIRILTIFYFREIKRLIKNERLEIWYDWVRIPNNSQYFELKDINACFNDQIQYIAVMSSRDSLYRSSIYTLVVCISETYGEIFTHRSRN